MIKGKKSNIPKVTVITVTYNAETILEETLKSIINQNYNNLELIIVDGDSKDKTVDIIKKYERYITKWISESDKGIFDAMNKGIQMATGTWVNFMNAGDTFYSDNVLENITFKTFQENKVGLIYGNTCRGGVKITYPYSLESIKTGGMPACHQSMFFNRLLLNKDFFFKKKYDSLNRYGDVELVARLFTKNYKFEYIDRVIANFLLGGASTNISWITRYYKYKYILKYFGLGNFLKSLMILLNVTKAPLPIKKEYSIK